MHKNKQTILDYTFVRLYIWYKRRYQSRDKKQLVFAAKNGMAGCTAFLCIELTSCFGAYINNLNYLDTIHLWGIVISAFPIFYFIFHYSNEDRAEKLIREYEELDEAQHAFFKRRTRFIIFLIQILCASLVGHRMFFQ